MLNLDPMLTMYMHVAGLTVLHFALEHQNHRAIVSPVDVAKINVISHSRLPIVMF